MLEQKEPLFYENYLLDSAAHRELLTEDHLANIESILAGLEKGLSILEKMGKTADPRVLENRQRFLAIKKGLLKLL